MKNTVLLFCCFLSTNVTLHCMELSFPDYKETEKILIDDCKHQVRDCLERYKKSDEFTPQDMENILEVISFITHAENSADFIHCIKDDEEKGFFQYALWKIHLPIVEWLIGKGNIKHHSTQECVDFIAFCAEQLAPNREKESRETAIAILKVVIEQYKTNDIFKKSKEPYIKTMIKLQLAHRALESQFIVEEELLKLLTPFLSQDQDNTLNILSDLYQKITDEQGNTLAHIVVGQHDADELHKLIKKNRVTKRAENCHNMTVCKLAFNNFREFTKNATADAVRSEKAQARRCCHFMLDRYFAENQKDFIKKQDCCEKHSIPKRYDADGEISKSSSSQSMSSSSSSSSSLLSQDIINSSSLKPTKNPFFKRTLADDEESMFAAHCPRLYNCFYPKSAEEDMIVKRLLEK